MRILKRIDYNSPVILTFVILSFAALLLNGVTNGWSNLYLFSVYRSAPTDVLFYFRLFGHVLGHAGWDHFIGNILILLIVGPMIEEKYGSKKVFFMILVTAGITGLCHVLFFNVRVLGASGIVFMLILLSSITSMKEQKVPLTLILVAIVYMGDEIKQGIVANDNVSQISHIIGGICGIIFGILYKRDTNYKTGSRNEKQEW